MKVEKRIRRLEREAAGKKRFLTYTDALTLVWAKRRGEPIPPELEDLPLHPDLVTALRKIEGVWQARLASGSGGSS